MAVICDGMGGLAKGELASSYAVSTFDHRFSGNLEVLFEVGHPKALKDIWLETLNGINIKIRDYSHSHGFEMGTTFTGLLIIDDEMLVVHVGDSRIYHIGSEAVVLTEDHTYVAREVSRGNMSPEAARTDKRRNMLLQCIGASDEIHPQIVSDIVTPGIYLVCSDGFRHELGKEEMAQTFDPHRVTDKEEMTRQIRAVTELVKERGEQDNISAILIKAEDRR